MIDPALTPTLFAKRTKDALVKTTHPASVFGTNDRPVAKDVLLSYIADMTDKRSPRYMGFTSYMRKHNKDHIIESTAITLEYPYSNRIELEQRLAELNYPHYQIDTQADFTNTAEARIVVAFPLASPISDTKLYARVASLLWDEIGIKAHTKSHSVAATFLFAPYLPRPRVVLYNEDQPFLDAVAYRAAHKGQYVDAGVERAPKPKLETVSDDGLWAW